MAQFHPSTFEKFTNGIVPAGTPVYLSADKYDETGHPYWMVGDPPGVYVQALPRDSQKDIGVIEPELVLPLIGRYGPFLCQGCGKQYRFKYIVNGALYRCPCGQEFYLR